MLYPNKQQAPSSCSSSGNRGFDGGPPANETSGKIRVEFAVNINNQNDLKTIEEVLKRKGVNLVSSDVEGKMIQLDLQREQDNNTNGGGKLIENAHTLQRYIEEQTGLLTVVKGVGELSSAVAELRPPPSDAADEPKGSNRTQILGVIRMSQLEGSQCYVDGSIDGLDKLMIDSKRYSLAVHEFGDLGGEGYKEIGNPIVHIIEESQSDAKSASDKFRLIGKTLPNCDVASMIGRSIALTELSTSSATSGAGKQVLSAGVVARASTIGANKKQICSCSGKTLWEERLDQKQTKTTTTSYCDTKKAGT